jgi:hypothetical protein
MATKCLAFVMAGCIAVLAGAALPETKVEVKKTHICCPQ